MKNQPQPTEDLLADLGLPQTTLLLLKGKWQQLLDTLSQMIYRRFLAKDNDHYLIRLHQTLNFSRLETACQGYQQERRYTDSRAGRPIEHTVPRLVRVLMLKHILNTSLRETEEALRYNLLYKWFCGYSLHESGPDHSIIERFEQYVRRTQPRLYFDDILTQIDDCLPQQRQLRQNGDTFAMFVNAAPEHLIRRLNHSCEFLLLAVQAADPVLARTLALAIDPADLWGQAGQQPDYLLSPDLWLQRLTHTTRAALTWLQLSQPLSHEVEVQVWRTRLQKIISDELDLTDEAKGVQVRLKKKRRLPPL